MIELFYTTLILFIWNEIYYIKNKIRLDKNFKTKSVEKMTKLDVFFYMTRVLYWTFIIIGLFSSLKLFFIIILVIRLIQIPIYHLNKKLFIYYDNFLPLICSLLLVLILLVKIIS